MRSIVSNDSLCLICKSPYHLQTHNIFYGNGLEELSKKYGCWCYLCARHHFSVFVGAHCNAKIDKKLKAHTQKKFNEAYPELDFVKIFGVDYLKSTEREGEYE